MFLRRRLKKDLLRKWFANWNISNKARVVSLKSTPAFFRPWPCLAPADRPATPYSSSAVLIAHNRRDHRVAEGLKTPNPGHGKKQCWKNPTWCSGAVKTFMHYGVVFHNPATTASNKPGIHRVECPLSSNSLGWQRLHFPWEDSFFQNLGSSDPGQHMTNSAAVSHDGCCLPCNTTETVGLPRNI